MAPVERFERVILPHLDDAYTLARYLLRNVHDAQDAVQDAALRAFKYFDTYQDGDPRAWFLAIVRNACMTWLQRHKKDRATVSLTEDHLSLVRESRATDAAAI
jgi:RNA polymerase sigma-70 factor (ECF subfamily)